MSNELWGAMWHYLVFDRHIDTDEAECIISQIEEEAVDLDDAWEMLEDIV